MTFAVMALYPLLSALTFRTVSFVLAIPVSILIGYLLLPANVDINVPLLPALTKTSTPVLVTFVMVLLFAPRPARFGRPGAAPSPAGTVLEGWLPRAPWVLVALALMVFGPLFTALFNRDPLVFGPIELRALTLYDGASMAQIAVVSLLSLLIGRRYLSGEDGHRALLLALLGAGLVYSLPTLAEIRLSPQLHALVYGYFPHDWLQHVRGDGFRPLVFLNHALVLSMFLTTAALAIAAYMRAVDDDSRILYFLGAAYLTLVVFLSKSLGMTLVAFALLPVLLFAPVRLQMAVAAGLAVLVLLYPALRVAGVNPLLPVVQLVETFDPARAASLQFRLDMEDGLLARMLERPLFGWGSWGRSELWSPEGHKLNVRDGMWIILIGERGIAGFLGQFLLLCGPVLLLALRCRAYALTAATSGLSVVLMANVLDLIPNAGFTPYTLLMAGALVGRLELGAVGAVQREAGAERPDPARPTAWSGEAAATLRPGRAEGDAPRLRPATGLVAGPAVRHAKPGQKGARAADAADTRSSAPAPKRATAYSRFPVRPDRTPGRG